jgi:cell division protein FtsN
LAARGVDARVVGTVKPFRVRVGRYETRAAAVAAQKQLKAKKLDALITEIGSDDK